MHENFVLTKLNKSDVLSVFLAYHDSLSCVCDIGLDEDADSQQRFDRHNELEKWALSTQEYLTKAEKYIETINNYSQSPENFVDLSHHPQQISYKNLEPLTDNFSNFLEDLNKAYDNFFKFFIGTLFSFTDTSKSYKAFLEYKPKGKKTPEEIKIKKEVFYSLLKDVSKDAFDTNFTELTNLYFDVNKKRNSVNHGGKINSDLIKGHYTVSVDTNKQVTVKSFPLINFHNEQIPLDKFTEYAFNTFFYSMQNLYAACVNTVLKDKPKTAGLDICPQLYPVGVLDDVLKNNLRQNGKIHSDKQAYVFGLIGVNNEFINFSCSRPQDSKFIDSLKHKINNG
jgi:hypothetical protein